MEHKKCPLKKEKIEYKSIDSADIEKNIRKYAYI